MNNLIKREMIKMSLKEVYNFNVHIVCLFFIYIKILQFQIIIGLYNKNKCLKTTKIYKFDLI